MTLRNTYNPFAKLLLALLSLLPTTGWPADSTIPTEDWRPQFHFTPATNWMNDPNGMVYFEGEYHLFYQFNPFGIRWGHMSWGHAVSRDLVQWEHLPIALLEENGVMIFSGSAVVDWKNTSGFGVDGKPPMVAIYTGHYTTKPLQNQQIAYSNDRGRTWTKYAGNPVIDIGEADFRDPKVFWHEPTQKWIMAVSWPKPRQVRFYASENLKQWSHLSDFGPAGSTTGIWECPDLFPVKVEGPGQKNKWVLVVNVGSGAPAGGSGCQYFVGDFDGHTFRLDPSIPKLGASAEIATTTSTPALWADWGRDFYAAVSWSDVPAKDGRRLWLGWMSNWEYANDVPTVPWRSAMSVPRELTLRSTPTGMRLVQRPVRELAGYRGKQHRFSGASPVKANQWLQKREFATPLLEVELELQSRGTEGITLELATERNETIAVHFDPIRSSLILDRTRSGRIDFHEKFPGRSEAPLGLQDGKLKLSLLIDRSSLEVFGNDGLISLTSLMLPEGKARMFRFLEPVGSWKVQQLRIWELQIPKR